mmetsp:Transcript_27056/g.89858  ORF Transcript_27056/g.89858 Transcript_27056/m.89858 type:complete len:459 (-) Transcript_27056:269-1645(-)
MPRGKPPAVPSHDLVTPRQFCWACVCFLASVLVLQICILAVLLRRLSELQSLAVPEATAHAVAAAALAQQLEGSLVRAAAPHLRAAAVGGVATAGSGLGFDGRNLALGVAVGMSADSVLLFLSSLLRASDCDVTLLVDQPLDASLLQAEDLDQGRITFETIARPLPAPWEAWPIEDARYWLFKEYLNRAQVQSKYDRVQLSDVDDVAFQADPFAWLAGADAGVHAFAGEPSQLVRTDAKVADFLRECYGVGQEFASKQSLAAGYVLGAARAVAKYADSVAAELESHQGCQRQGVHEAMHNYVLRREDPGFAVTVHENRRGPVWTGGKVPKGTLILDRDSSAVLMEDRKQYTVLHQYTEHEDLWRRLTKRFLKSHHERLAVLDCSAFDVEPGDMPGFDLDHVPAETSKDCCVACLNDATNCGGFAFSEGRRHCWLKLVGGIRRTAKRGDDMLAGLKIPR